MAKKMYRAILAFESVRLNQVLVAKETERIVALVRSGYLKEVTETGDPIVDLIDDGGDNELLERFEELDVVEVVTAPTAKRRVRKE